MIDPSLLLVAGLISAVAATVHGTVGFGYGLLAVPTCALLHPSLAPSPQILVAVPLALIMVLREGRFADRREIGLLLLGGGPGALCGIALVKLVSERGVQLTMAATILLGVVLMASGRRVARTPRTIAVTGVASGAMMLIGSIGGPPVALLYRDATGPTLRGTLALYFLIGDVVAIGLRWGTGEMGWPDVVSALWLLPGLLLGLWLARFLIPRVEGEPLRRAVLGLATGAALMLAWRAW
jgi:uncharacterized membrane protein YfcA